MSYNALYWAKQSVPKQALPVEPELKPEPSIKEKLEAARELFHQETMEFENKADAFWEALPYDKKLLAFYSVVSKIYQGEIKDRGSFRYVLYEVFGFGPESYFRAMDCGYLEIHNMLVTDDNC